MNHKMSAEEYFCYECQHTHNISNMQKYDCVVCEGRKCHNHGGKFINKCLTCNTTHLCIDCVGFAKCCKVFNNETCEFTFVGTKIVNKTISKY